jgi:hypothetical protein
MPVTCSRRPATTGFLKTYLVRHMACRAAVVDQGLTSLFWLPSIATEEAENLLIDRDSLMEVINGAHDNRVGVLLKKEDEARGREDVSEGSRDSCTGHGLRAGGAHGRSASRAWSPSIGRRRRSGTGTGERDGGWPQLERQWYGE